MLKKISINIILIISFIFALIGLYWLTRLGLEAGSAYLWLTFIGMLFILIALLFKMFGTDFWFEIPISKNPERGLLMFIVGICFLILFFLFSSISGLNFATPFAMSPLAFGEMQIGANSFAALQAATSPFWTFFITVISAAVIEEIILGFAFVVIGSLVFGYGLRKLLKIDFGKYNEYWDFVGAMIFSVILFSILHIFNNTYINADGTLNIGMFTYAAFFRLILNILIYKFGNFGLLFSIGVHATNNAFFLGKGIMFKALGSFPGGIILDVIFIILIIFGLSSIKQIWKEGKLITKDFFTFD